jgi:hypothetical protein
MADKTAKPIGRFAASPVARSKSKVRVNKSAAKKPAVIPHDQMLANAKKSPPPQVWFDEDLSKLRGPKA